MFNTLLSIYPLCAITGAVFSLLFFIRNAFIKQKKYIFLLHTSLLVVLFIALVGGSVQNDAYKRLEQFVQLEQDGQLKNAQKEPAQYDSMLQIDLTTFNNSDEFKKYLEDWDILIDKAEAITVAWIFLLLTELCFLLINLIELIFKRKKS
ncbi:MAG: hypothetical protein EBU90_08925 [Proteobacteria bacterium]|nr:hypothetical protein [Pseudomonadota bacterium]NBP14065.1 hypothetical protein [bacterium]